MGKLEVGVSQPRFATFLNINNTTLLFFVVALLSCSPFVEELRNITLVYLSYGEGPIAEILQRHTGPLFE